MDVSCILEHHLRDNVLWMECESISTVYPTTLRKKAIVHQQVSGTSNQRALLCFIFLEDMSWIQ
ncbi:hypothetical protein KP509_10G010800 [Ceratopteris richardii]|uniref:Uncharacterized protein n=1 Tax=Ceratopteris richardii TaxID=49495 RepID=A0A8T2TZ09_CERRI|nr:hypothetical protein KP509_10G010800 [Ceratopteris richardii]